MTIKTSNRTVIIGPDSYPAWAVARPGGLAGMTASPGTPDRFRAAPDCLVLFDCRKTAKRFMRAGPGRMRGFRLRHLSWGEFLDQCRHAWSSRGLSYLLVYQGDGGNRLRGLRFNLADLAAVRAA